MNQTWSVVVFCYNEVGTVEKVVTKLVNTFEQHRPGQYEIVIVDDGSSDGSDAVIRQLNARFDVVRPVFHKTNRGIGHALRTGYVNARNENLTAVPADGQFNTDELIPYLDIPANSFVSYFRLENTTYTMARNALSYANRMVNKLYLGFDLKDVNWVKIYKTADLHALNLEIESSLIESEICAKLLVSGRKVVQVESRYHPREAGVSKGASWYIVRQALRDTLTLGAVLRRFRVELKRKRREQAVAVR
nr:glycosyltransferase family 2 protein [uncultured Arsenicibacter sp.]